MYLSFISRLAKFLYMLWLSQVFENINIADMLEKSAAIKVTDYRNSNFRISMRMNFQNDHSDRIHHELSKKILVPRGMRRRLSE